MVGSGLSTLCDVERLEEEEETARAERNPPHIAMAETVGLESPCDLIHKDKTHRVLTKIPVSSKDYLSMWWVI
jgi:hypothetical protein